MTNIEISEKQQDNKIALIPVKEKKLISSNNTDIWSDFFKSCCYIFEYNEVLYLYSIMYNLTTEVMTYITNIKNEFEIKNNQQISVDKHKIENYIVLFKQYLHSKINESKKPINLKLEFDDNFDSIDSYSIQYYVYNNIGRLILALNEKKIISISNKYKKKLRKDPYNEVFKIINKNHDEINIDDLKTIPDFSKWFDIINKKKTELTNNIELILQNLRRLPLELHSDLISISNLQIRFMTISHYNDISFNNRKRYEDSLRNGNYILYLEGNTDGLTFIQNIEKELLMDKKVLDQGNVNNKKNILNYASYVILAFAAFITMKK